LKAIVAKSMEAKMKVKRIYAKNIRSGMLKLKKALGDDAVILANRKTADGIELIVGVEYDADVIEALNVRSAIPKTNSANAPVKKLSPEIVEQLQNRSETNEKIKTTPKQATKTGSVQTLAEQKQPAKAEVVEMQDPFIHDVRRELHSLGTMMQNQLNYLGWGKMCQETPNKVSVLRQLTAVGLGSRFSKEIVKNVNGDMNPDQAWRHALGVWANRLRVTDDAIMKRGGIVALIGQTGVGKTTTVAKLAAKFADRHGKHSVLLVANDNQRVGAQEQLLGLGRMLGISVVSASNNRELREILTGVCNKKLVLIDTAGWHPTHALSGPKRTVLFDKRAPIQRYLVLSCNAQIDSLERIVNTYHDIEIDGCILTKLDEAASLGGILTVVASHKLPLAYITHGHRVPDDIQSAKVSLLLSKAVALSKAQQCQPDEDIMAIRYGRAATKIAV
jgi:flagellar biosynthesis protein FlhF